MLDISHAYSTSNASILCSNITKVLLVLEGETRMYHWE